MHNEAEHNGIPYFVYKRDFTPEEYPSLDLLHPELARSADFMIDSYRGTATHPYIADAFNAAFYFGMKPEYLLGRHYFEIDIHPAYYKDIIEDISNPSTSKFLQLIENDAVMKRFAQQLSIQSGHWNEAFHFSTKVFSSSKNQALMNQHENYKINKDPMLAYYLMSILFPVLKVVESRDGSTVVNKDGSYNYHLGLEYNRDYNPNSLAVIMRSMVLSNKSTIKVINPDPKGRISHKMIVPLIQFVESSDELKQIFYGMHRYNSRYDKHLRDLVVVMNNILSIWVTPYDFIERYAGELTRATDFIKDYTFDKAMLATHSHGYNLEALETFDGMPKKWVRGITEGYPFNYRELRSMMY